jgi:hypothetical protein
MKSIARAFVLFNLVPCTGATRALGGDQKSSMAAKAKDNKVLPKSPEEELRAEIRKEVQHELAAHDVQREVLVQSSIHNAGGSGSMMEQFRALKVLEQKEHKTAKHLAEENHKLHQRAKHLRHAFLEERATVKADSKQLQHMKQQQKAAEGTVQKLKDQMQEIQHQSTSLQSSLAHEKQLLSRSRTEFSKLQLSDSMLVTNFTKLSNTSKMNEDKLKKQGLFLLNEIHATRGQLSEVQDHEHKLELQTKEKEHELASVKASMLQEGQRLQRQSLRELNAVKQKLSALQQQRSKEKSQYMNELHMDTTGMSKLRTELTAARSQERMTQQELAKMGQKNARLVSVQASMSKELATIQTKSKAALSAKEDEVHSLEHHAALQLQSMNALQETASQTAAQLRTITAAETADKAEIATMSKNAMSQKVQLMSGLKEIAALQDKLEAQAQSETALARQSLAAQTEAKNEMASKDAQISSLTQASRLHEQEASAAEATVKQQSRQLEKLKRQLAAAQASEKA